MKRYWLFAGIDVCPSGGMGDFYGDFDTLEEAQKEVSNATDWYHIFDTAERRIVAPPQEASASEPNSFRRVEKAP